MREYLTGIRALRTAVLLVCMTLLLPVSALMTEAQEEDAQVAYDVYIRDDADLLTDAEEEELYDIMLGGTGAGNMVFMTIDHAGGSATKDYIEEIYQTSEDLRGTNAVIYVIDMDNRLLWITGYGENRRLITPDYGNLITDNVYQYAGSGDYATSAIEGYRQIVKRLSGSRVSGTLRGVGNLCIAVILAEILCFAVAYTLSASRRADADEVLDNIERMERLQNPGVKKTGTRRVYDPPSSSSGSSGGSRSSGGGGFHGGGGGHGF